MAEKMMARGCSYSFEHGDDAFGRNGWDLASGTISDPPARRCHLTLGQNTDEGNVSWTNLMDVNNSASAASPRRPFYLDLLYQVDQLREPELGYPWLTDQSHCSYSSLLRSQEELSFSQHYGMNAASNVMYNMEQQLRSQEELYCTLHYGMNEAGNVIYNMEQQLRTQQELSNTLQYGMNEVSNVIYNMEQQLRTQQELSNTLQYRMNETSNVTYNMEQQSRTQQQLSNPLQYGMGEAGKVKYNMEQQLAINEELDSSYMTPFQFLPLMPDKMEDRKMEKRVSEFVDFSLENCILGEEDDSQMGKSFAFMARPASDGHGECETIEGGLDLNKTPQQKTPRRRKHRPKIITEGAQKRTPRAPRAEKKNPIKQSSGKRKYVRRKLKSTEEAGDTITVKKQRRKLVFDSENSSNRSPEQEVIVTAMNATNHMNSSLFYQEVFQSYGIWTNSGNANPSYLQATEQKKMPNTCSADHKAAAVENFTRKKRAKPDCGLSAKRRGKEGKQKSYTSINELANQMGRLDISDREEKKENLQSALVPYKADGAVVPYKADGAVVPYTALEPIKKQKPRAKIELDPETDRVWKLLMGKEATKYLQGTDKENEQWWEEERRVFCSRANSFIAKMHLVQGDRRFSKWKGSVVDSVIGVFLTQNVSDHLSSSAFMSLAARFPHQKRTHGPPPICVCLVENELSSQDSSVESMVIQANGLHCCSDCNSEAENRNRVFNHGINHVVEEDASYASENSQVLEGPRHGEEDLLGEEDYPPFILQVQEAVGPTRNSWLKMLLMPESPEEEIFQFLEEGRMASWPSSSELAALNKEEDDHAMTHKETLVDHKSSLQSQIIGEEKELGERKLSKQVDGMRPGRGKQQEEVVEERDWDCLRMEALANNNMWMERSEDAMDTLDYEAIRCASVNEISDAIKERGMNNVLAERIKGFLNRLVKEHGNIDLEWLKDVPPEKAKEFLLSIRGLGLKSVECVRLLTLQHLAFPVDTNVGRIAVRLGWVPLKPLPESLQLHLLELYPILESIQKYLWPRLCKLDQRTLYELHYQMITFGKVFCTKSKPNCNACPMRAECRHFASAFASSRLALPGPEEKRIVPSLNSFVTNKNHHVIINHMLLPPPDDCSCTSVGSDSNNCIPIIEEPTTPEPEPEPEPIQLTDIEDLLSEDPYEIPTIKLNMKQFTQNLQNYMQTNMEIQEGDTSMALVTLNPNSTVIPTPKLKNINRLRTEHQVYQLPDSHPLLEEMDRREPDDLSPYLLAIWTPGETADSSQLPTQSCESHEPNNLCNESTCLFCSSVREAHSHTVRGTILIPCRTAMRGRFPLNGTYFQVNEVFADHKSSLCPINVPRQWIWNLPRRTVYFGTSVSSIFKGLSTEEIQYCFWKGFVCVRGFEQKTGAPRPLTARLHFPASRLVKEKKEKPR